MRESNRQGRSFVTRRSLKCATRDDDGLCGPVPRSGSMIGPDGVNADWLRPVFALNDKNLVATPGDDVAATIARYRSERCIPA
jgi:hypothetical protein